MSKEYTPKTLAEDIQLWLDSELGKHYMAQLSLQYNHLHQDAERDDMTAEQKAFKVERAAGVKQAITWLTSRVELLKAGRFDEKKKPKEADKAA